MRVLVAKEKHGDRLLAADTEEALAQAAFTLLKERWEQGWYEDPDDIMEYREEPPYTDEQLAAIPEGSAAHRAATRELNTWHEYERTRKDERQFYAAVKSAMENEAEALAHKSPMFTGRIGAKDPSKPFTLDNALSPYEQLPSPWVALCYRKDHEYEYVELREVELA